MSVVTLSSKAGKIFWGSLLGYTLTYGAFFYTTQYALSELENEVSTGGMFTTLSNTACEQMKGCKAITYLPLLVMNDETNKYAVQVSIDIKSPKEINLNLLNGLLDEKREILPWYVNNRLDSIQIGMVNGEQIKPTDKRAEWYVSLMNKFGK